MANRHPARQWYNPLSISRAFIARPKILIAIAVSVIVFLALQLVGLPLPVRATLAWDAGALTYLIAAVILMSGAGTQQIRQRAAQQDEGAIVIPIVIIAAIAASFLAVAGVLSEAKDAAGGGKPLYLLLAGATILFSWSVLQVIFTFHYAHEFYAPAPGDREAETALEFAGDEKPDYWDFFYFSTTVGATSQTSDTEVASRKMRRLVTVHAIISFFFNTIILALTINIAAGLI